MLDRVVKGVSSSHAKGASSGRRLEVAHTMLGSHLPALRSTPSSASLLAVTGGDCSGAEATGGHRSRVRPGLTDAGPRSRNAPTSPEDAQRRQRCANLRVAAFRCESKCGEEREVGPSTQGGAGRSAEAAPRRGELPRVMPRVVPCSAWPGALVGGVRNVYQQTSKLVSFFDTEYRKTIRGAAAVCECVHVHVQTCTESNSRSI
jgi:hypothetical protein